MNDVGIGIVGAGARLLLVRDVLKHDQRLRVVALCDPSETALRGAREAFGDRVRVYDDYRALCADPAVDWVFIGSWNCFHHDQALAAFGAGKHVFCEKPLAINLEDCLEMYTAWQESGRAFSMGFTLRYSPHYRKIQEIVASGRLGSIISMEFNETLDFNHGGYIHADWRRLRANAGTHMLEKCCHDIDVCNWLTGSRVTRVASFGGTNFFKPENEALADAIGPNADGKPAYQTWPLRDPCSPFTSDKDVVDNQVVILELENGTRATFHTNCNTVLPERRMYVCGAKGTLRAEANAGTIEVRMIGFDTEAERHDTGAMGGHAGGDEILTRSLADSLLKGTPPFTGIDDGLNAAVVCFAIDEAMARGTVVDLAAYWAKVDAVVG